MVINDEGEDEEQSFSQRDFERKFFSDITNGVFCKTFLENALRDPVSGEIGKSIIFTVSQNHAARITQTLNEMADRMFPGKYNSDFAVQVTSYVTNAQQFSINFTNNNLCGSANFVPVYKTSKTRVCVTVGMMTTGYDCPDILNLCLMRPVFSPTDFIQIKGRGTRKHDFLLHLFDEALKSPVKEPHKLRFKLFDFFANCEYFEEKFNYDEILTLPQSTGTGGGGGGTPVVRTGYENIAPDPLVFIKEEEIGFNGMKIDRMFFNSFEEKVKEDEFVKENIKENKWDRVIEYVIANIMDKPEEYYTIEKLRRAAGIDRRLPLREILEKIFGMIPYFKSKNELLDEEFEKFISDLKPEDPSDIIAMKYFFKAYISNNNIRDIIAINYIKPDRNLPAEMILAPFPTLSTLSFFTTWYI